MSILDHCHIVVISSRSSNIILSAIRDMYRKKSNQTQRQDRSLAQKLAELEVRVQRVGDLIPFPSRIALIPPSIRYTFPIERVIQINVMFQDTHMDRLWEYGSPGDPTIVIVGLDSIEDEVLTSRLTFFDLLKAFSTSFIPLDLRGAESGAHVKDKLPFSAFNLFNSISIKSIKMWGPTGTGGHTGTSVKLTVIDHTRTIGASVLHEATVATLPVLVPSGFTSVRATGSRSKRASCGVTIPQMKWSMLGSGPSYIDVADARIVEYSVGEPWDKYFPRNKDIIAIFHVSISGIIGEEYTELDPWSHVDYDVPFDRSGCDKL